MAKKDNLDFGGGALKSTEGLSEEEKDIRAQIRRRAVQLIDGGMSNTQAAQQAFSELYPSFQQSLVKEPTQ